MGNFISTILQSPLQVANAIAAVVTDPVTAIQHLNEINQQLTPPALYAYAHQVAADSGNVNKAIQDAIASAKSAALKLFTTNFPTDTPAGSDSGVVSNYQDGGNVATVTNQIKQDFSNWDVLSDSSTINAMAATIQEQVSAQIGKAGVAYGTHYVNQNQYFDWTVAYGLFAIADGNNGLVYGFSVAFNSGF